MKRRTIDVSSLPPIAFGPRDPLWWAVTMLIAIEGTMLALLAVSYIYVRDRTTPFPPGALDGSLALIATLDLALWAASAVWQRRATKAAVRGVLRPMRRNLLIATVLATLAAGVRVWLFLELPFRWDSHAYGSVIWGLLAVQWVHGLTAIGEDVIYVVLMFTGPVEDKHRVDVEVSAPLVYFVVAGGVLVWAIVLLDVASRGGP
jgi:cytochrome c oxidase subunit III